MDLVFVCIAVDQDCAGVC